MDRQTKAAKAGCTACKSHGSSSGSRAPGAASLPRGWNQARASVALRLSPHGRPRSTEGERPGRRGEPPLLSPGPEIVLEGWRD